MTDKERREIKAALLQCAKENENRNYSTFHIVVSSICRSAKERIEELEQQVEKMKCCGNCNHNFCNESDKREFGYNKANEWHKQDIDNLYDLISKDWDIRYFICVMKDKSRVTAIGSCNEDCNGEVSVNLFFEHEDEKYYMDDIVWWKEIVLPKEIVK